MRIEFDGSDQTITVDGVKMSLELLRCLANPEAGVLYSIARQGDIVTLHAFQLNAESLLGFKAGAQAN